ncbi:unnamed protein product [Albugo candida]|uniref:Uncharacterized protein n=1 Tax=Albugo candida TaxID=65357 RepID=A0A024FSY4_9STRA|nr:unnamed protein product [Albugo candida]|eukprot:CCI10163.1 unnamed protein product [Albugo candida]
MQKYRCSLLGHYCRLLVQTHSRRERGFGYGREFRNRDFPIFDDVMSTYSEHGEMSSDNGSKNIASRPVYTHEHLRLDGRAVTHNRYMENCSLEASFDTDSCTHAESLRSMSIDHISQALTEDATILMKLHGD